MQFQRGRAVPEMGTLATGCQDRVTMLTFASEVILVVKKRKAFLSTVTTFFSGEQLLLIRPLTTSMLRKTVLACCLNGDVSDNKYYYTLQAFHEQQVKSYKHEDEVNFILTMTFFT